MQNERAADYAELTVQLANGVVEHGVDVSVRVGDNVSIVTDVSHRGAYVTVGLVQGIKMHASRSTNLIL